MSVDPPFLRRSLPTALQYTVHFLSLRCGGTVIYANRGEDFASQEEKTVRIRSEIGATASFDTLTLTTRHHVMHQASTDPGCQVNILLLFGEDASDEATRDKGSLSSGSSSGLGYHQAAGRRVLAWDIVLYGSCYRTGLVKDTTALECTAGGEFTCPKVEVEN